MPVRFRAIQGAPLTPNVNMLKTALKVVAAELLAPRRLARAHSGTESYVYVVIGDHSITGNVQFPISDLNGVMGLSMPQDEQGALAGMAANRQAIEAYATEHLTIGTDGAEWAIEFNGHRMLQHKAGSYAILDYRTTQRLDPVPRSFAVSYDGIIHAREHHEALVIVNTSAGYGPLTTTTEQRLPYTAEQTTRQITIPEQSAWKDLAGAVGAATGSAKDLLRRARKPLRRSTATG